MAGGRTEVAVGVGVAVPQPDPPPAISHKEGKELIFGMKATTPKVCNTVEELETAFRQYACLGNSSIQHLAFVFEEGDHCLHVLPMFPYQAYWVSTAKGKHGQTNTTSLLLCLRSDVGRISSYVLYPPIAGHFHHPS